MKTITLGYSISYTQGGKLFWMTSDGPKPDVEGAPHKASIFQSKRAAWSYWNLICSDIQYDEADVKEVNKYEREEGDE
jgi:hypothetical protein